MSEPKKGSETVTLSFQIPVDLLRDLDAECKRQEAELGLKVSRSGLVRKLIKDAVSRGRPAPKRR